MMNNTVTIRQETPGDFYQVSEVIKRAFEKMEESDHTEQDLVSRLRQSDSGIPELSLMASTGYGQIIGHILLSKAEVVAPDGIFTVLALAPLSVIPEFQRMGIGGMLIRAAHKRAADLGYKAVILLGHKDYYPRFGYKKASQFGIKFPFDVPDDYCMVAELAAGALSNIHGMVHYPDAFCL